MNIKQKRSIDQGKVFGVLLRDISKAFDWLTYELIITKLNAYGLPLLAFKVVSDYLINPKQITKIINSYRSSQDILFVVQQGSGPSLV